MRRPALLVLTAALAVTAAAVPAVGSPDGEEDRRTTTAGCATPLFDAPVRARDARRETPGAFRTALSRQPGTAGTVAGAAADPTLWLDACGRAFYREAGPQRPPVAPVPTGEAVPADVDVLDLHSRPGARRVIHLDVDGHTATGTAWNAQWGPTITTGVFDFQGGATTDFTEAERTQVHALWEAVAEDYAPFGVDVTTADPGQDALTRSSASDRRFGTRVAIGASPAGFAACGGCGGVAYVGTFDATGPDHPYYQPAWAFTDGLGHDGRSVAEAVSHEAGHNLGLDHDGRDDGTTDEEYYWGHGRWAPIMGTGYGRTVTQWSPGDYAFATTTQDDLAVMVDHGAPLRPDDHGGAEDPTPLTRSGGSTLGQGVVERAADVDGFSFTTARAGQRRVRVLPTGAATNLDVRLTVVDYRGRRVARVNPAMPAGEDTAKVPSPAWLAATWTGALPAGSHTLLVEGVAAGSPARPGWSDYGSLGAYRVVVSSPSR